ncbi:NACHT domain-containing protein [Calothrix membranacea FACHB-236]|nr:NACHT domain-containing protein [Calothrix membranacea FACHB-236]
MSKQVEHFVQLVKAKTLMRTEAILQADQPVDYKQAVLELETTIQKDLELMEAVHEVVAVIQSDSRLAAAIRSFAVLQQTQPSTIQNFDKLAEEIQEIKAVFQGNTFVNSTLNFSKEPAQRDGAKSNRRIRQVLLAKVKNFWVKGVLETSLHQQVPIALGLQNRQDTVAYPWNWTAGTTDQMPQDFLEGTSVISVFDKIGVGRTLLILGDPGSGKTISLLHLAKDLIARAEENVDSPVPVVLNLSSWALKEQSIEDWLIEELHGNLYQISKRISRSLIEQHQLLLLLDGLDEVHRESQNACVKALNLFQRENGTEMVVCCRVRDYQSLSNRLNVQRAVYLRPLTLKQVQHYLNSLSSSFDLRALKKLLAYDTYLQELAQSPLRLNMMVLAYGGLREEELGNRSGTLQERQKRLFNDYINRMFEKSRALAYALHFSGPGEDDARRNLQKSKTYLRKHATQWLISLAQQMISNSQTFFLIEYMQPTYLKSQRDRKIYKIYVSLIGGLIVALVVGLFFGLLDGVFKGLFSGLLTGTIFGLIAGLITGVLFQISNLLITKEKIKTVENLVLSWIDIKNIILIEIAFIGLFGVISGLFFWLTGGVTGLIIGTIGGMMSGAIVGLTEVLSGQTIEGLDIAELQTKVYPNQGIYKSAFNSLTVGMIVGLITGVIVGFVVGLLGNIQTSKLMRSLVGEMFINIPNSGLIGALVAGIITTLLFGFITGLNYGGKACIQHFALRILLYQKGFIPWNYARFLDWATERIFLQKVGGSYTFIHRLLMEHFARMPIDSSNK